MPYLFQHCRKRKFLQQTLRQIIDVHSSLQSGDPYPWNIWRLPSFAFKIVIWNPRTAAQENSCAYWTRKMQCCDGMPLTTRQQNLRGNDRQTEIRNYPFVKASLELINKQTAENRWCIDKGSVITLLSAKNITEWEPCWIVVILTLAVNRSKLINVVRYFSFVQTTNQPRGKKPRTNDLDIYACRLIMDYVRF